MSRQVPPSSFGFQEFNQEEGVALLFGKRFSKAFTPPPVPAEKPEKTPQLPKQPEPPNQQTQQPKPAKVPPSPFRQEAPKQAKPAPAQWEQGAEQKPAAQEAPKPVEQAKPVKQPEKPKRDWDKNPPQTEEEWQEMSGEWDRHMEEMKRKYPATYGDRQRTPEEHEAADRAWREYYGLQDEPYPVLGQIPWGYKPPTHEEREMLMWGKLPPHPPEKDRTARHPVTGEPVWPEEPEENTPENYYAKPAAKKDERGQTRPSYRPDETPKFDRDIVTQMIQQGDWHQLHDYLEETDPEGKQQILEWDQQGQTENGTTIWYSSNPGNIFGEFVQGGFGTLAISQRQDGTSDLYIGSQRLFMGTFEQCQQYAEELLRISLNQPFENPPTTAPAFAKEKVKPEEQPADQTNPDLDKVVEKIPLPELLKDAFMDRDALEKAVQSKRPEQVLKRLAKPVGPVNPAGHHMAMQEQMVGVNIDGMNLLWNPEAKMDASLREVVRAIHHYNLPPHLMFATKNLVLSSQEATPADSDMYGLGELYQQEDQNSGFCLATGGNTEIVFYKALSRNLHHGMDYVGWNVVHEMAHNMGQWAFGALRMAPPRNSPYGQAVDTEGPTSRYSQDVGKTTPEAYLTEDFAESVAKYYTDREAFKQKFPLKEQALVEIMGQRSLAYNRVMQIRKQNEAKKARPAYRPDEAPKFHPEQMRALVDGEDWSQLSDWLEEVAPEYSNRLPKEDGVVWIVDRLRRAPEDRRAFMLPRAIDMVEHSVINHGTNARPAYRPDETPKFNRGNVTKMIQQDDWHQLHDYLEETDPNGEQPILEWSQPYQNHGHSRYVDATNTFEIWVNGQGQAFLSAAVTGEDHNSGWNYGHKHMFSGTLEECQQRAENIIRIRMYQNISQKE